MNLLVVGVFNCKFIFSEGRNNSQWSPMGPRYPGQHMNPNYPGGMPPHMSSPYQRGPMRMSPNRDKHMSPQRMQVRQMFP